ncbi:MAG: hypothetical protein NZM29_01950, partial [Nitrospira sp.]|nr:hypothetical protein [Nitrospira sp.]
ASGGMLNCAALQHLVEKVGERSPMKKRKARADSCPIRPAMPARWLSLLEGTVCCLMLLVVFQPLAPVCAETRVISASGEYRMGERDTKEDAVRLAVESAKRNALEQVATYVESVTVTRGMNLTKDEIRTYTAGVVLVREQRVAFSVDGETVVVKVDLVAEIDTEEVIQAIAALRKNEDARTQLAALRQETERLRRELDRSHAQANTSPMGDAALAVQRKELLYRVQSNAMLSQAWTDWALIPDGGSSAAASVQTYVARLLQAAREIDPNSPHLHVAEKKLRGSERQLNLQSSLPSLSPREPAMPRYELVPGPGRRDPMPTLNEVVYRVPERASRRTSDPTAQSERRSRSLEESQGAGPLDEGREGRWPK